MQRTDLSGEILIQSYSKDIIFSDTLITESTKTDSCFKHNSLDKIFCYLDRKLNSDSPPFYGECRNYHRDDSF